MTTINVTEEFINYRTDKAEIYNQRGRSDRKFLMDLDAELYEWEMLRTYEWVSHPSWMVDGIDKQGIRLDVKFIRKYWNVSREKTLNLIKQRKVLEGYLFMEWVDKPNRPLVAGDAVTVRQIGFLQYDTVADNLRKSFKEPDGFYVDVHTLIRQQREKEINREE